MTHVVRSSFQRNGFACEAEQLLSGGAGAGGELLLDVGANVGEEAVVAAAMGMQVSRSTVHRPVCGPTGHCPACAEGAGGTECRHRKTLVAAQCMGVQTSLLLLPYPWSPAAGHLPEGSRAALTPTGTDCTAGRLFRGRPAKTRGEGVRHCLSLAVLLPFATKAAPFRAVQRSCLSCPKRCWPQTLLPAAAVALRPPSAPCHGHLPPPSLRAHRLRPAGVIANGRNNPSTLTAPTAALRQMLRVLYADPRYGGRIQLVAKAVGPAVGSCHDPRFSRGEGGQGCADAQTTVRPASTGGIPFIHVMAGGEGERAGKLYHRPRASGQHWGHHDKAVEPDCQVQCR